ncbi:hypothetical protein [Parasphingorhabdus sp.]|uniref:hypothetical protein n=1 Tax=Parasphingorhabdus sp. TaxID=2709688 RepID=UPI003001A766
MLKLFLALFIMALPACSQEHGDARDPIASAEVPFSDTYSNNLIQTSMSFAESNDLSFSKIVGRNGLSVVLKNDVIRIGSKADGSRLKVVVIGSVDFASIDLANRYIDAVTGIAESDSGIQRSSETFFVDEVTYDALLECWVGQWPNGVAAAENAPPSEIVANDQLQAASQATKENCPFEIDRYRDQIGAQLTKAAKLSTAEIEQLIDQRLDRELEEMFGEYWSRV